MSAPSIAIVGSGPSACYTAQALRKHWPQAPIVLFERLPVPFGLVRYGVAADHQGTKAVTRQFERLFSREAIDFLGNIEIGRDLSLEQLRRLFDRVVLATGLYADRPLNVPGQELPQVYGSGAVTRLLNEHPDCVALAKGFGPRCLIIGQGNVAMDLLRFLLKPVTAYQGSDFNEQLHAELLPQPVREIHIVGRSPVHLAKFDTLMLREIGQLGSAAFQLADTDLAGAADDPKLQALHALAEGSPNDAACQVTFHFGWQAQAVLGQICVSGVRFSASDGSARSLELQAESVFSAIGFTEQADDPLSLSQLLTPSSDLGRGYLDDGLYCTGWLRRGPHGSIAENRQDARLVADSLIADWPANSPASDKLGCAGLAPELLAQSVDFAGWQRIDQLEQQAAPEGRVRRKIRQRAKLLALAHDLVQGA